MTAGIYDTEVEQGADWVRQFVYSDSSGSPIDISGAAIAFKAVSGDGTAVLQASVGSGITITNAASGMFTILIPAATTRAISIPNGSGRKLTYDILVTISAGVFRILRGTLTVTAGIAA
jgi:hypothetical protein